MKCLLPILIAVSLASLRYAAADDPLARVFIHPPAEARPCVYWYWMNGNVSREGIIADLRAMEEAGIGGVFLMDIGIHPAGPVKYQSRAWYEMVKLAVSEAQKRGIQVSFHCPGWSASGGPWVTPEMAMQELTWSQVHAEGGREMAITLPRPPSKLGFYRDIAVLAWPMRQGDDGGMGAVSLKILDAGGKPVEKAERAMDRDTNTAATLPGTFDLVFVQPVQARTLWIRAAQTNGAVQAVLSAWDEGRGAFVKVASIRSHTSGPFSAQIGSASFPSVKSSKFRLEFTGRRGDGRAVIEELEIGGGYRLPEWVAKAGFATDHITPRKLNVEPGAADIIPLDAVVNLSDKLAVDGKLTWNAPPGKWTILRLGHTPTGIHIAPAPAGGDGLECDKMSKAAADFHYDHFMSPLLKELGPELAKGVAVQHVDSYEAGWQNWTSDFPREFANRRGYDLLKYLPAVTGRVVGDVETTEKFLWDFRRTIGDLYADNHYGHLAARSHQDGLGFSTEPYGGPFDFVQVGTRADFPMIEFWLPTSPENKKPAFHGVFAGHVAGRKIIGAEAFTSGPPEEKWTAHPASLKAIGDYIWTSGVNRFVIHVFAHQPFVGEHLRPGLTCASNGIHFDRANTWWPQARAWVEYLTRSQAMLQQGRYVADVLYFQGDDSPHWTGPFQPGPPEGYDFDACGYETLAQLQVKDGQLVLPHGKSYRYLVLPADGRMTLASLARVVELAQAGATIVGMQPAESSSLADASRAAEVERLRTLLWGDLPGKSGTLAVGKGRMLWGKSFEQILADGKFPADFAFDPDANLVLHAVHRQVEGTDVYFVANASPRAGTVNCTFRVTGKRPELWYTDTGRMVPVEVYETTATTTRIPLHFEPAGSVFVVFKPVPSGTAHPPTPLATDLSFTPRTPAGGAAELKILDATYGPPKDPARSIDVTKQVTARVKDNRLNLRSFESLAGDPAPGIRKELRLRYALAGVEQNATAHDGQSIVLPVPDGVLAGELSRNGEQPILHAFRAGRFTLKLPSGVSKTIDVHGLPDPVSATGPWELSFPAGWGAPTKVKFDKLISWSDQPDPGVRYFSGTSTYRAALDIPADRFGPGRHLRLDLGDVQVIAEVKLNGQDLGILWKPPFAADITRVARPGRNELEVRVTNLWPNRLIGDEQYPDDCTPGGKWLSGGIPSWPDWLRTAQPRPEPRRLTFTALKLWKKDDALLPSGLLGPVRVTISQELGVEFNPTALPTNLPYGPATRPWGDTYLPKSQPPARRLQFVDVSKLKTPEVIALTCLQGLTSRKQPCIWLNHAPHDQFWLDWHVEKRHLDGYDLVAEWKTLFREHADASRGAVIADPDLYRGDLLALNVAACEDLILATPELANELKLPVKVDLRGRFKTYAAGMEWIVSTYKDKLNHHLLEYVYPHWLRSGAFAYSLQWRAPMIWVAGPHDAALPGADLSRERKMLADWLAVMSPNAPVIGFPAAQDGVGPGEVGGVALASRYAHPLVCTNFLANACITSGVRIDKLDQPQQPPAPRLERDKIYIALNLSDGDNQNIWLGFYKDRFFNKKRFGDFPLAFGMGPPILDLQPARAQWYFEHARPGIEFIADVSGIGYMHPDTFGAAFTDPAAALDDFLDWTNQYMDRLGMRTLRPVDGQDTALTRYAARLPKIHSIFADMGRYTGRSGIDKLTVTLPDGLPVFHSVTSWRYGKDGFLREIREQVGPTRPAFVNAFVHCWTFNDLDLLAAIYDARDADMVFVTPAQLAQLHLARRQAVRAP